MSCPSRPSLGDVPRSLPIFLLAHCGDSASWIYSDQRCDGINNCGDCSDELSPGGGLGTGGRGRGRGRGREGALQVPCMLCLLPGKRLPTPSWTPLDKEAGYERPSCGGACFQDTGRTLGHRGGLSRHCPTFSDPSLLSWVPPGNPVRRARQDSWPQFIVGRSQASRREQPP